MKNKNVIKPLTMAIVITLVLTSSTMIYADCEDGNEIVEINDENTIIDEITEEVIEETIEEIVEDNSITSDIETDVIEEDTEVLELIDDEELVDANEDMLADGELPAVFRRERINYHNQGIAGLCERYATMTAGEMNYYVHTGIILPNFDEVFKIDGENKGIYKYLANPNNEWNGYDAIADSILENGINGIILNSSKRYKIKRDNNHINTKEGIDEVKRAIIEYGGVNIGLTSKAHAVCALGWDDTKKQFECWDSATIKGYAWYDYTDPAYYTIAECIPEDTYDLLIY